MSYKLSGVAASPGIAISEVLVLENEVSYEERTIEDTGAEKERLATAIEESKEQLTEIKQKVE
ncbi:MAG: phosphoenolpyruvate-utilizing N-terminal domain-containing protein, partial [Bacillota bacterium]